jgi:DNA-binding GntR family transcriptional regulator
MYDSHTQPRSAAAQVVAHVKEAIRSGRLVPGQRLLESELTARLGMSRGPVREALAQLQVEGFIDVAPHRGARVHQMSRAEMLQLFHVRVLLAGEAAKLAAGRVEEGEHAARLETELARQLSLRNDDDLAAYAAANVDFHTLIDEMCGNALLASMLDQLQTRVGPFLRLAQSRGRDRLLEQHIVIARAILDGDGGTASRTMRRHVNATLGVIMELPESWFE